MEYACKIWSSDLEEERRKMDTKFRPIFGKAQKEEKRIKIDPFTPENSAFPEFPVEFSTDFLFLLAS